MRPCAIHWVPRGNTTLRGYSIQCRHTCMHGSPWALVGQALVGRALVGPPAPCGLGPCGPPRPL